MKILDEIERYLIRAAIFGFVLLVVVQGLMTSDSIRFYLSLGEHMEGQKIEVPASAIKDPTESTAEDGAVGSITIKARDFTSLDQAFVLVNDRKVKDFSEGKVTIQVTAGDVVEVDTRQYSRPVEFLIENTSSNVKFPEAGTSIISDTSIEMLGRSLMD